MPIVMKFGGTSVANAERVLNAARLVAAEAEKGRSVVVVVSAQGDATDDLIERTRGISAQPSQRETDALLATGEQASAALMAMAVEALGYCAVSLCGWQAGIVTRGAHGDARILHVGAQRIEKELAERKIVVVAGFQGISESGDITTIGRGGSDTTAVALAAALGAKECRIYTDVSGVFSADPRAVPGAVRHRQVGYDEMNTLASMGAKVLHGRSVSLAKSMGVPVTVLSSFEAGSGTRLVTEPVGQGAVTAVTCENDIVFVRLGGVERERALELLCALARAGVSTDLASMGERIFSFCAPGGKLPAVRQVLGTLGADVDVQITRDAAKLSAVGSAVSENPLVAAQMLSCLSREGIEPLAFATGDLRASVIIGGESRTRATQLVHDLFFDRPAREEQPVASC